MMLTYPRIVELNAQNSICKGKEMEGKPWTVEEEKQLQQLLAEKKSV